MLSNNTKAWQQLQTHKQNNPDLNLAEMFAKDPTRFAKFSLRFEDILFDYSKQLVSEETMGLLLNLANAMELKPAISALFNGAIVNQTEQRAALHTQLRNPKTNIPEITQALQQMADFVTRVHASHYTDIIVLGIGGSDLGPRLVCAALKPFKCAKQKLHFVSNVDSDTLFSLLQTLDPKNTLCLINSKTFTTVETLSNAQIIKAWLKQDANTNCFAITANPNAAQQFGINPENIFLFWDWVGGRYSVWSVVGLAIALQIGMDNFKRFLHGAYLMDQHFLTAPFAQNLPVILGLLGIWQINFQNYATLCIAPYTDGLELLPAYLQQLEMESNGKGVNNLQEFISYQTAPVIWGGVGCNGQHAYMQMLHQGTQVVPVDFLVAKHSHLQDDNLQQLLVASCIAQSQALMTGKKATHTYQDCPGNRPSTTIMCEAITPELMGKLLALYEHKVYVQGVIWQIDSFDQWGVQLGKDLITDLQKLTRSGNLVGVDSSTAGLLQYFLTSGR